MMETLHKDYGDPAWILLLPLHLHKIRHDCEDNNITVNELINGFHTDACTIPLSNNEQRVYLVIIAVIMV